MSWHLKVGGTWKELGGDGIQVKVGGTWKAINTAHVKVAGTWKQVYANFNEATGGTVTTISNYNGTGQTWKVHTFTSNGTFTVNKSFQPFRCLVVGGGGAGAGAQGLGGEGGDVYANDTQALAATTHAVTIGAGGKVNGGDGCIQSGGVGTPTSGGASKLGAITANGGAHSFQNGNGPAGTFSNITGTSTGYGGNGARGSYSPHNGPYTADPNSGGGNGSVNNIPTPCGKGVNGKGGGGGGGGQDAGGTATGARGGSGVVIVAYRIA